MKKFKRIVALLTVVCICCTCTAFAQSSEENIDILNPETIEATEVQVVIKNEEALHLLSYLNIVDDSLAFSNTINRVEFVEAVLALGELTVGTYDYTKYSDMTAGTEENNAVMTASEADIVRGYGNSVFEPNRAISVNEAATMIVRAMGYEQVAISKYGNTGDACLQFARSIGIVKSGTTGTIDGNDAIELLYNALEADYLDVKGMSSDGGLTYAFTDNTYLEEVFGIVRKTGVVTNTPYYADLVGGNLEGKIEIDGTVYTSEISSGIDINELMGMRVYYYEYENQGDLRVVLVGELANRNKVITITPDDYVDSDENEIRYYNDNDKKMELNASDAIYYYNDVKTEESPIKDKLGLGSGYSGASESLGQTDSSAGAGGVAFIETFKYPFEIDYSEKTIASSDENFTITTDADGSNTLFNSSYFKQDDNALLINADGSAAVSGRVNFNFSEMTSQKVKISFKIKNIHDYNTSNADNNRPLIIIGDESDNGITMTRSLPGGMPRDYIIKDSGTGTTLTTLVSGATNYTTFDYIIDLDSGTYSVAVNGTTVVSNGTYSLDGVSRLTISNTGIMRYHQAIYFDDLKVVENPDTNLRTVKFMVGNSVYEEHVVSALGSVSLPEDPVMDDMTFMGWYDKDGNLVTEDTLSVIRENVTYGAYFVGEEQEVFEDGEIIAVDNDRDGGYDYIFVREYTRYAVEGSHNGVLTSLYDDWRLDTKTAGNYKIYSDGVEITTDHIGQYNEIKVMRSLDGTSGIIHSSGYTTDGTIKNIRTKDRKTYVTISSYLGDVEYELEGFYVDAYTNNVSTAITPTKGMVITAHYNDDGRIYAISKTFSSELEYGYMIGIASSGGLDKNYQVKIFGMYGEMQILDIADNFKVNGNRVNGDQIATALTSEVGVNSGLTRGFVLYRTDKDGKLAEIVTATDAREQGEDRENFSLDYQAGVGWTCNTNLKTIGTSAHRIPSSAIVPVFVIPADGSDDGYLYFVGYDDFETIAKYTSKTKVELYDCVKFNDAYDYYKIGVAVLYMQDIEDTTYYSINAATTGQPETAPLVVHEIEKTVDQNGDPRWMLTYSKMSSETKNTIYFADEVVNVDETNNYFGNGDIDYTELEKGDIISILVKNPYVTLMEVDRFWVWARADKYEELYYNDVMENRTESADSHIGVMNYWLNAYGEVVYYDGTDILVKTIAANNDGLAVEDLPQDEIAYLLNIKNIYPWEYKIKSKKMELGAGSCIVSGDRVWIRTKANNPIGGNIYCVKISEE